MKLGTLNIRGIQNDIKRANIFSYIKRQKLDIVCFQETHLNNEDEVMNLFGDLGGDVVFSNHAHGRKQGVCTWFAPGLDIDVLDYMTDNDGRIVSTKIKLDNLILNIVNIYAPNAPSDRMKFIEALNQFVIPEDPENPDCEFIFVGDWNFIEDIELDKMGGGRFPSCLAGKLQINDLKNQFDLVDIFRKLNPNLKKFTFYSDRYNTKTRIDRIYVTPVLDSLIKTTDITPCIYSDHDLVHCSFLLDTAPRGPGTWKMNNSYLQDRPFRQQFIHFWTEWQNNKNDYEDPLLWWDLGKVKIRNICQNYGKHKKSTENYILETYQKEYDSLLVHTNDLTTVPEDIASRIDILKDKIEKIETKRNQGIMIRSKIQYREEGEKCTRYFVQLEKQRAKGKIIDSLRLNDGTITTDQKLILDEEVKFYKELYKEELTDQTAQNILLDNIDNTLTDTDRDSCEGHITLDEAETAVQAFKCDKSPGSDGLTAEFYRCFWKTIGQDFVEIANFAFDNGRLSTTQRRGIISLIFKKGDKLDLKNWRPISLLNIDYKIITKILTNRIKKVLPSIIHPDQTSSVPGRSIAQTTAFIRDLIDYVNRNNLPGAIICLDQMKAFDRVDWKFMFKTLRRFGFGPQFINWVQLCYTDITSSVKNNGFLSTFFELERGTRQGCPLSALLYVLVAEVLAINIRKETKIKGIILPDGTEHKLAQFADDNTVTLSDVQSIESLFSLIRVYESASGARVNQEKTEGLWVGSFKGKTEKPLGLKWSSGYVKALGFYFGNVDTMELNWRPKINNFNKILNCWMYRDLTMQGRVVVLNNLASAGLWYHSNTIHMPEWAYNEINRSMVDFFWKRKKHHVRREVLHRDRTEGGQNLVDIKNKIKAQRVTWISKINEQCDQKWAIMANYFIGKYRGVHFGKDILESKIFIHKQNVIDMPQIYKEFLKAWQDLIVVQDMRDINTWTYLRQNLFLNNNIVHGQRRECFLYNEYIESGIKKIYDVWEGTRFKTWEEVITILRLPNTNVNRNQYNKLINAIPNIWIEALYHPILGAPDRVKFMIKLTPGRLLSHNFRVKTLYPLLLKKDQNPLAALPKWQRLFHTQTLEPSHIFGHVYKKTLSKQFSDFQWKFCHMILPTGHYLHQMQLNPDTVCLICGKADDTLVHAFTDCPKAANTVDKVQNLFSKLTSLHIPIRLYTLCFGFSLKKCNVPDDIITLINYLLYVLKFSIWRSRQLQIEGRELPAHCYFSNIVRSRIKEEHFHAKYNELTKREQFLKIWCYNDALCTVDDDFDMISLFRI